MKDVKQTNCRQFGQKQLRAEGATIDRVWTKRNRRNKGERMTRISLNVRLNWSGESEWRRWSRIHIQRTDLGLLASRSTSRRSSILNELSDEFHARLWDCFDCERMGIAPEVVSEDSSPLTESPDQESSANILTRLGFDGTFLRT